MKSKLTKIPAIIGLILNVFGLILFLHIPHLSVEKRGAGFAMATLAFMLLMASLALYLADAILSIIKASKKIDPVLNTILAIVILVPMILIPISILPTPLDGIMLLAYFPAVFVMEIASIFKTIKVKEILK